MALVAAVAPPVDLTASAIALHQQSLAADAVAVAAAAVTAAAIAVRPRATSDASSALSSVASSSASPPAKRWKGQSTPPTSIDEPRPSKRAAGRRGGRAIQSEYDVKDRKEYLDAGLYAPTRGNSQPGRAARVKQAKANTGRLLKTVAEIAANFRMELPQQDGLTVMQEQRDFRLPCDILNDFDLSRLPDTVEGTAYRSDALDRLGQDEWPTTYRTIKQSESIALRTIQT